MIQILRTAVLALTLVLLPAALAAEDAPVTCQQTTDRVLKPFLDAVAIAEAARDLHAEESARKIERQRQYIADLRAARKIFDDQQAKDMAEYARRIAAAEQAIADIRADIAKHLADLNQALTDALSRNAENDAKNIRASIARYQAEVAAGKITGYAPPLGFSATIGGWTDYIAKQSRERAERNAAFGAGEVALYVPMLGYSPTWNGILKLIADTEADIAKVTARLEVFYMPMLGYSLDGPKIDKLLADRQEALAKARAEIAAGTFVLYVPTYGYSTDRNHVLADIGKARASLARVRAGWGDGSYRNYNPLLGHSITKGEIDARIRQTQTDLAAYIAAGGDARAYVRTMGHTTTGTAIAASMAKATTDKARQDLQRHHQSWREGRAETIAKFQETLARQREQLAKHREIWLDDIAKREEDLAGRLARALAETPCGGGTPETAHADAVRGTLSGLSENDFERDCREARFDDAVLVGPDGTVHGDVRAGYLSAMSDTGLGDGSLTPGADGAMPLDQTVLMLKNYADQLAALAQFGIDQSRINDAVARITALTAKLEQFEIASKGDWRAFKQMRAAALREIRGSIDEVMEASLYFSGKGMDQVIAAMGSQGLARQLSDAEAQQALSRMLDVRRMANTLNTRQLPRMADLAADLARVTDANLDAARAMMQTVRSGDIAGSVGSMSKFEKGLLFLAVAAAAAEASDRMAQGQAPEEAVARAGVNLAVELAIGGIPITAAAHAATLILFNGAAYMTDDPALAGALSDATVENVAKAIAQSALDQVGALGAAAGEAMAASEFDALDNSASREAIQAGIATAETRLAGAAVGSAEAAALMRARARLRQLDRAKARAERIREVEARLDLLETAYDVRLRDESLTPRADEPDLATLLAEIGQARAELDLLRKWDC